MRAAAAFERLCPEKDFLLLRFHLGVLSQTRGQPFYHRRDASHALTDEMADIKNQMGESPDPITSIAPVICRRAFFELVNEDDLVLIS